MICMLMCFLYWHRISFVFQGCFGFSSDHWQNWFLYFGLLNPRKGMLLLVVALLYEKLQMTRWSLNFLVFPLSALWSFYLSATWIFFGLFLIQSIKILCIGNVLELMKLLWFVVHEQALAIKMALEAKGISSNVYVGMRYWYPFTEEAIQQVSSLAFWSNIVFLHYSHHTSISSFHN